MKKKIVIPVVVIIAIVIFLAWYKFPQEIHTKQPVVQFIENNPNSAITTTMQIDGYLYKPFLRKSTFEGHISINSIESTKKDNNIDIVITEHRDGINMGNITYQSQVSPFHLTKQGIIWFDDNFEHINIWASSEWTEGQDKQNSLYIVGAASDLQKALSIQSDMRTRFGSTFIPKQ